MPSICFIENARDIISIWCTRCTLSHGHGVKLLFWFNEIPLFPKRTIGNTNLARGVQVLLEKGKEWVQCDWTCRDMNT